MGFELERVLYETEDFLRRAIGSPTRRAAKKRRMRRRMEEFGRRAKRSAFVFTFLLALLVAFAFVSPLSILLWIVALPTLLLIAVVLMFQPTRASRRLETEARLTPQSLPLPELAIRAEEGLLDRCDELPGRALPATDRIMANLRELQPHLHELGPADEALAGDIRRLVGQHLPQLVDSWLALPASARTAGLHRDPLPRGRPAARELGLGALHLLVIPAEAGTHEHRRTGRSGAVGGHFFIYEFMGPGFRRDDYCRVPLSP